VCLRIASPAISRVVVGVARPKRPPIDRPRQLHQRLLLVEELPERLHHCGFCEWTEFAVHIEVRAEGVIKRPLQPFYRILVLSLLCSQRYGNSL